jgi:hypothetical protein
MVKDNSSNKDIEYRRICSILIGVIILINIISIPVSASDYQRPEYIDGLEDDWHPGSYCIPCHYTLLGTEKAREISLGCENCHALRSKGTESGLKIDMSRVYDIHKDVVCIRCHIGTKNEKNVTSVDFHMIKSKMACETCHTVNDGMYSKPPSTKCSDCHSSDPHVVHGKNVENLCVACHGEFGEKYIKPPAALVAFPGKPEVAVEAFPTIGEFMSKIIESLIRIIRG